MTMTHRLSAALGAAFLILAAGSAAAQSLQMRCGTAADVAKQLTEQYGESQVAHGPVNRGAAHGGLWLNRETRTWTVTVRLASGLLCLVLAGEGLEFDAPNPTQPAPVPGKDS
jgi:hypothetical protein